MTKRMRILTGSLLLGIMTINLGATISSMFLPPKGSDDGWRGDLNSKGEVRIAVVTPNGPATALQVGDEVIAINGVKIKEDPKILNTMDSSRLPPGTGFTMTIRRAEELHDVVILTVPRQVQFNPVVLIVATFLLAAWIVFLLRPDDKQAWLLAEAATRSSPAIIEHFVNVSEAWANGRPQDNDVTFVVLKMK